MAKVKNTKAQPIDVEIKGDGENLHLGPRGVSRELTEEEFESVQVQANLKRGNLVIVQEPKPAAKAKAAAAAAGKEAASE